MISNKNSHAIAKIISLIDLTSLNVNDTNEIIENLCQKAVTPLGSVAAVCIYPEFLEIAKDHLSDPHIKLATVANFPSGDEPMAHVMITMKKAILDGANEIDVVFPYQALIRGEIDYCRNLLSHCKQICGPSIALKVILETGALNDQQIEQACELAIQAGANFLKTSTGKIPQGASLTAAKIMLEQIKKAKTHRKDLGFKASGGIRDMETAQSYILLAENILGDDWVTPQHFRLGASSLLDELLKN